MSKHAPAVVLVAEDEPVNQKLVAAIIERCGYQVQMCHNGRECLDQLQNGLRPDLLLLDLMMPVMDGMEVLSELNKSASTEDFPIIVFSAKNEQESVVNAINLGANDYVVKPFQVAELERRLTDLIFQVDEGELKQLMSNLRFQDPSLERAPGLASWAAKDFGLYPTTHCGKSICVLVPQGQAPQALAKLDATTIAARTMIFRKCAFGWRKVWPKAPRTI